MNQNTPITEVMSTHVVVGHATSTLHQLKDLFLNFSLHHLIITDEATGKVTGIVSANDLLKFVLLNPSISLDSTPVAEIMTTDVISLTTEQTLGDAVNRLNKANYSGLVIEEDQKPVGFFSVRDLSRVMGFMFSENYNYD